MSTATRCRWMREYMKEYRQGKLRGAIAGQQLDPDKRERLKETHRFDSFKWRLSKLLSPQYEILLCIQFYPEYGVFRDNKRVLMYEKSFFSDVENVRGCLPILDEDFTGFCDEGGGELFKVFLFVKYGRKFDRFTQCVVGVLDKAVLLEGLQKLPIQGVDQWKVILNKVKTEARQGTWRKLDVSKEHYLWVEERTVCYSLKWTMRKRPQWDSLRLRRRLYGWTLSRALRAWWIGQDERYEWPKVEGEARRLILSPLLRCDASWFDVIA